MKWILISLINLYQKIPFSSHKQCRFIPTCSEYTKEAIKVYGSFKGTYMGIKRIARCNPLSKNIYDPVPIKINKKENL